MKVWWLPLPCAVVVLVGRSPYLAPVLFGARQWWAAFKRVNPEYEPEAVG